MGKKLTPRQIRAAAALDLEKLLPVNDQKGGETVAKDDLIKRTIRALKQ